MTALPADRAVDLDDLLAGVAVDRMMATVRALASDAFEGRRVGTAGGSAARAWLAQRLSAELAVSTGATFAVPGVKQLHRAPHVLLSDGGAAERPRYRRDFTVHLSSAELSTVRRGALSRADGDLTGRWVVLDPADPATATARAVAGKAAGLVSVRGLDGEGWMPAIVAGPTPGPLPALSVAPALHRRLLGAADAGVGWLEADAPLQTLTARAANLYATAPASSWSPDVLLTAHFDGVGDDPGTRMPAASDNATGVAVVCEAATIWAALAPAGLNVSIALLDAEETGAAGSAHHATELLQAQANPAVVNIDGAGQLHEAVAVEAGGPAHALLAALDRAGRATGVPLRAGPVASDNRRYAGAGFAAIGLGAGVPGYHTPADTADRVQPETLRTMCRLVLATLWECRVAGLSEQRTGSTD